MQPGALVAGRFAIEAQAAVGGMGVVYRAVDRETGAKVALKVVVGRGLREVERFSHEALLLAELRHPGIVRYIAHGATPEGQLYLAMDWLEGEDLAARLARAGMSVGETVALGRAVAEALSAAHARGIVHRDIKPSNVFLEEANAARPKILDFGIARLGYGRTMATRTGVALGTPGYMSPEQARGDKDVDARADVFSLGCVLFECLTGRPAFAGEHLMAILSRVLLEDAPRVRELRPDVPAPLDHLVATMLSKDPAGRPKDATAVAASLGALDAASAPSSAPAPVRAQALTAGEQRLICMVLATPGGGGGTRSDATLPAEAAEIRRRSVTGSSVDGERATLQADDLAVAVSAHGGTLERLADGSVLAVHTGAGTATDLATRAARCALAMRPLLPGMPMAVATGRGIVSERLPVGEAVESAVRVLRGGTSSGAGASHPGILVDEVSAGLLDGRFDIHTEGAGPEAILRLVGERGAGDSARTLLGRPSPCLGRERELALLAGLVDEAIDESAARVVLVTGAPGIGKSRFAAELQSRLAATAPSLRAWHARGDAMRAGAPLGMLADLVRHAVGIGTSGPVEGRRARIRARVEAIVPAADVERVAIFLAELAGAPFSQEESPLLATARGDAMLMGDQMRRAFEDWLEAECRESPVLLVLEDLHFGDLPTVRFVDAALRHARDRPLVVLGLARPEVDRTFPRLFAERSVTELRLVELGRRAGEQLVRLSLGAGVSDETVARILERAGGSPFYVEEIVRAVASGRAATSLPGTVLAMVQARLEELDPWGRRVLRAASVFGEVFWPSAVAALLGGAEPTARVDDALRDLVERELVVRRGRRRFADHEELAFRSALVRETAYASLTDADRMLGHRLAGAWLEAAGEPSPRVLAEHFERGGAELRAAEQYGRAARDALAGNDFSAVVELVDRAIACGASGEAAGQLRQRQAEAQRWRSEFGEAECRGLEAIRLLPEGGDAWMGAVGEMATVLGKLGSVDRVAELGEALLRRSVQPVAPAPGHLAPPSSRSRPVTDAHVAALARTSTSLLLMSRFDLAEALFVLLERAVGDPEAASPARAAWYWRARAFRAPFRGEVGASARHFMLSAEGFDRMGDVRNACLQRANFGAACLEVGDWEAAERALRPTLVEAERMGAHHIVSSAKRDLGYALARTGRLDEALSNMLDAVKEFADHGDRRLEGVGRDELAFIRMQQGDLEGAEREARAAVERLEVAAAYQCHALATLSRVLLRRGQAQEAVEAAARSLAILKEVGALEEGEGLVRLALAEALWGAGRDAEAKQTLAEAHAEIERRAAAIDDPEAKRTFREQIPEHVETAALARERLGI